MNVCYDGATTQQNYGTTTEKLAFEYDKSFLVVKQQIFINKIQVWQEASKSQPFLTVPFTICCIRNSLPYVSIRKALLDFL